MAQYYSDHMDLGKRRLGVTKLTPDVEDKVTVVPEVSTYGQRSLGATTCPGILVDSFALTL